MGVVELDIIFLKAYSGYWLSSGARIGSKATSWKAIAIVQARMQCCIRGWWW